MQNTLNGLENFFQGKSDTTYWVGYDKEIPFAFLITSPEGQDATTVDLFICDLNYLGKGLAVSMIREFLIGHFSHVKKVLIDPEATNTRAIHVYQKAGFRKRNHRGAGRFFGQYAISPRRIASSNREEHERASGSAIFHIHQASNRARQLTNDRDRSLTFMGLTVSPTILLPMHRTIPNTVKYKGRA